MHMTFMMFQRFSKWVVVLLSFVWINSALAQNSAVPSLEMNEPTLGSTGLSAYKLAAGDVVTIRVLGEDELSKEKIRLTDAGTISYPALGEIKILGLTTGDLERIVTSGLKGRYLVNPKVSVQIEEYRPFYVSGMVEKPGSYPFQPGLNVRKAASVAGGFKERASLNKIFIIRDGDPSQKPQKVDLATPIFPGDTITVEESFF